MNGYEQIESFNAALCQSVLLRALIGILDMREEEVIVLRGEDVCARSSLFG